MHFDKIEKLKDRSFECTIYRLTSTINNYGKENWTRMLSRNIGSSPFTQEQKCPIKR